MQARATRSPAAPFLPRDQGARPRPGRLRAEAEDAAQQQPAGGEPRRVDPRHQGAKGERQEGFLLGVAGREPGKQVCLLLVGFFSILLDNMANRESKHAL